jgi:ABC-type amino acid transport substrate-binding protein
MSNLNLHGELLEDGKWDGIIGMLAARQVDVSCSDLTMTTSRVDVVDFIEPIWADR